MPILQGFQRSFRKEEDREIEKLDSFSFNYKKMIYVGCCTGDIENCEYRQHNNDAFLSYTFDGV